VWDAAMLTKVVIWNDRLRPDFQPVLTEWIKVIRSHSEFDPSDPLYWYNERASLSTFASALARTGSHVLEEHSSRKNHGRDT
jgi:hypothetical protein